MPPEEILKIVLREMTAYGNAWRMCWADFDGRSLRNQLNGIADWAYGAKNDSNIDEYKEGTEFYKYQVDEVEK